MYTYVVTIIDYDGVEDEGALYDSLADALREVRRLVREARDSEDVDCVFGIKLR